jgi:hypothetical protein
MSFGKNPHVAKAENAEQKAREARDEMAREQAWLEAARRWERAAERETDDKRRALYLQKCEDARARATQPAEAPSDAVESEPLEPSRAPLSTRPKPKGSWLN